MMPNLNRRALRCALLVVCVCAPKGKAKAQDANNNGHSNSGVAARASHRIPVPSAFAAQISSSIVLDGRLDEAAWQQATPITEFRQHDPDNGQPASERIDVRFLHDDGALYIGAMMYDRLGAAGVTTSVVRRDNHFNSDYFEVVIDGYHDHLSRAFFFVNPSGSKQDLIGIGTSCCDDGWDPVWEAETRITDEGWIAEIRIPYSQLRFSRDSVQTWGLNVRRFIQRTNEYSSWSWWDRDEVGGPNRFGHLEGLRITSRPRNLEILPYAMSKSEHIATSPGNPFSDGSVQTARVGLDLRYLVTSNLTLDATINPDFGQVEVDPAVVNLSAFETFFSERRPFFVSGSGVFGYGGLSCFFCSNVSSLQAFYSRRIGRAPTGADLAQAAGDYADIPDAAPILGAAKLTGRTANGYTVGVLNAVTGRTRADVRLADGSTIRKEVEPPANYFVGRLKRDYMSGNLVVGLIGTSVVRDLSDDFVPRLSKHAEFIGTDLQYLWDNRRYAFNANLAMSSVSGDSQVILARQLSSARLYQRPDRGEGSDGFFATKLDSSATVMRGLGAYARIAKQGGDWRWEAAFHLRTPGFETNDYSFLTTADYKFLNANLMRNWTRPTRWYRSLTVIGGGQAQMNFDGDVTTNTQAHGFISAQTTNFWNVSTFYLHRFGGLIDDRMLRGGPSVRGPGSGYYQVSINTDSRKQWQLSAFPSYSFNDEGGWGKSVGASLTLRPSTRVTTTFGPNFNASRSKFQYVRSVADPTATDFDGRRYVLSDLNQRSVGFDTRVNLTFSPTMTLEVYAQPFISSQHYLDFKEFDAPREREVSVYGQDRGTVTTATDANDRVTSYTIDPDADGPANAFTIQNPDFNFRSLRGNAVFRWEYRPGSTLYLAWTQQRSDVAAIGGFDFDRDQRAMFDARPDNIFLVKASWWIAR